MLNQIKPQSKIDPTDIPKVDMDVEYYESILKIDEKEFTGRGMSYTLARKNACKLAVAHFQKEMPQPKQYIFF